MKVKITWKKKFYMLLSNPQLKSKRSENYLQSKTGFLSYWEVALKMVKFLLEIIFSDPCLVIHKKKVDIYH